MRDVDPRSVFRGLARAFALSVMAFVASPAAAQEKVRPVKIVELAPRQTTEQRTFPGRVRALQTVDLAFQVSGRIVNFPVIEGGTVAEGELVATLDRTRFERSLQQAEATLAQDAQDQERLSRLSGSAVPRVEVEAANTQAELSRLAVEEAQAALDDATLEAPFDAVVARRLVAPYTTIQAGEPVVRLHDMSETLIDINVPEVLVGEASGGDISFNATFPGRNETFSLSIYEFEAESADTGQTFRLSLRIEGDAAAGILPGASTMVLVSRVARDEGMILLPPEALVYAPDGSPQVMVFTPGSGDDAAGTVARTPVDIRLRDDAHVELVDGPPAGTEIVAAGASLIEDGQVVRRFSGFGE
ncbi:efflux RND transporter periplasmic adaptor subunit [Roseicyclus sp. F158]|uniref:Efflux RND transporter periplasmic adaptor subunit n=1 Tax=Tropicimonas omnivorans TaxID=3075590 RepID=A0ABU3DKS8_9RHOB|nr:efflux RND transporter periplasmic adaptor subunit [Roseicyclus sp. F158]MDT0684302.1 efflux RND transporter periplasmic adaptor subunit [Roseicyclus sp. F158]